MGNKRSFIRSLVLVVSAAILFEICAANKDWNGTNYPNYNYNYTNYKYNYNYNYTNYKYNYNYKYDYNKTSGSNGGGGFGPFGWWGRNGHKPNVTSKRIVVGGSNNTWHFGFNYTDWAFKNGPFYVNDKLVFRYDPPNDTTFPHSVYLLPNFWSFQKCDLKYAKKIGEVNQGGGEGFEFELKRWQPYYFACGEHNGIHCKDGLMKFAVWPLIRWNYN